MAAHPSMKEGAPSPVPRPLILGLSALAAVGLLVLLTLLIRELMPHHATRVATAAPDESPSTAPDEPVAPAPTVPSGTKAPAPAATQVATAVPVSDGMTQVRTLASIIKSPESFPATGVFHNRIQGVDSYSYDQSFGPFRRGELKRDAKNADAWEIDGSNGAANKTNLEDIAPKGALREVATVRDDLGNPVGTWFSVDSGPLAPAYATQLATGGTRVVSRAYLEANRAQFPPVLTGLLTQP